MVSSLVLLTGPNLNVEVISICNYFSVTPSSLQFQPGIISCSGAETLICAQRVADHPTHNRAGSVSVRP